jgi:hypothetical protein
VSTEPEPRDRPRQRWRTALAVAEVVVAALLAFGARWAWGRGIVSIQLPAPGGATDVVTRMLGNWPTLAVAAGTVAGLLVMDAARQLMLAPGRR